MFGFFFPLCLIPQQFIYLRERKKCIIRTTKYIPVYTVPSYQLKSLVPLIDVARCFKFVEENEKFVPDVITQKDEKNMMIDNMISKDDKDISTTPRSTCKRCTRSRKNVTDYIKRKSGVKSLPIPNNIKLFKKSLRKTQSERKKSKSKTQKLDNK